MLTLSNVFKGRENNLTMIRLLAAFSVIYGHSYAVVKDAGVDCVSKATKGFAFSGGVAVDLFFIISGFLVTASIINGGLKKYAISRILRIYPALWINLILIVFIAGPIVTNMPVFDYLKHRETWKYFLNLFFTYDVSFFLPGVFESNHNTAANGSIWSVIIEVRMYIVVAAAYIAGLLKSRSVYNSVFFSVLVFGWANPEILKPYFSSDTDIHVCMLFYIGSFLYVNRDDVPVTPFLFLAALLIAGMTVGTDRFAFAYAFLLSVFFITTCFFSQFSWLDRFGDCSYGVYLYGWPVQQLWMHFFPGMTSIQNAFFSIISAFALSALSWHYIEKPALSFKDRLNTYFVRKDTAETVSACQQSPDLSVN